MIRIRNSVHDSVEVATQAYFARLKSSATQWFWPHEFAAIITENEDGSACLTAGAWREIADLAAEQARCEFFPEPLAKLETECFFFSGGNVERHKVDVTPHLEVAA